MIMDTQLCSPTELEKQIAYLEATPVAGIANLLRGGQLCLKKGVLKSLDELGRLKTEFGTIGSRIAPRTYGERKFRVCEVLPMLQANPSLDKPMFRKVEQFMEKDGRGAVEYNVTILRSGIDLIVKDGNKRTIAFYERRKGVSDQIDFPVFLAEEPSYAA